jgi:RNA polymerase sigma-70 factor, ECF subfamily
VAALRPSGHEVADEAGLRDAYLTQGGQMFGLARRALRSPHRAEDAVQETFARAWRSRHRFDPSLGTLRTWLFSIERRVILDLLSREPRLRESEQDPEDGPVAEDQLEAAILGWQVETALGQLSPQHRMVVTEIYLHARTGREVADLFGIPEGTVRSRAYYALRALRLHLEEAGWNP